MEDLALGRALTIALRLLVDDMHERLAAQGFDDLRPAFGYVLNAGKTHPTTVGRAPWRSRTTAGRRSRRRPRRRATSSGGGHG
jgi:hypothetical protein